MLIIVIVVQSNLNRITSRHWNNRNLSISLSLFANSKTHRRTPTRRCWVLNLTNLLIPISPSNHLFRLPSQLYPPPQSWSQRHPTCSLQILLLAPANQKGGAIARTGRTLNTIRSRTFWTHIIAARRPIKFPITKTSGIQLTNRHSQPGTTGWRITGSSAFRRIVWEILMIVWWVPENPKRVLLMKDCQRENKWFWRMTDLSWETIKWDTKKWWVRNLVVLSLFRRWRVLNRAHRRRPVWGRGPICYLEFVRIYWIIIQKII